MTTESADVPDRFDAYHSGRPDVLVWLQGWFAAQSNGDWEHGSGVRIESLDNPGWSVRIELTGTELEAKDFPRYEEHRSEDDWLIVWVADRTWEAACGPLNLGEALHRFRVWAGTLAHAD